MTLASSLALSYYKKVADISREHGISLVQHQETGKFYVQKILSLYNPLIFQCILEHPIPGIPRIYEAVEEDSQMILIEEYVPGTTLQELLDANGPLLEEQVVGYMVQLCTILHALHSCTPPIVHRDIKPSNIIITPDGILKLLDLNTARYADNSAEKDTVLLGTPGFAAPEQYGFGASDTRTDIYALGILMNLLLTGELSHECKASGTLKPVIQKCIMMERSNRYFSVLEVKNALEKCSGHKETASHQNPSGDWRSFLPPGFRKGNPLSMLLGTIGYILVFWLSLTLEVKNTTPGMQQFERIITLVFLLGVIFFSTDYRNIQQKIPICRNPKPVLRVLGILLVDCLFFLFCAVLLTIYESIWG